MNGNNGLPSYNVNNLNLTFNFPTPGNYYCNVNMAMGAAGGRAGAAGAAGGDSRMNPVRYPAFYDTPGSSSGSERSLPPRIPGRVSRGGVTSSTPRGQYHSAISTPAAINGNAVSPPSRIGSSPFRRDLLTTVQPAVMPPRNLDVTGQKSGSI